jgi:ArsR family transcriptional regulator, arsenate/arsenite/antimonite-responsive transcriptional repressor
MKGRSLAKRTAKSNRFPGEIPIMANIDRVTQDFRREERHLTKVFKALSDSTRQEILRLLEGQQRTVGEIVGNFSLSQPTISRHLSVLKEADLVVDQRHGQNVIYRLNDDALSTSMQEFFGQFRSCQEVMR